MNECCIRHLVNHGLVAGFALSHEGERFTCPECGDIIRNVGGTFKSWSPGVLLAARTVCHQSGLPWRDPTTDVTYYPDGRQAQG